MLTPSPLTDLFARALPDWLPDGSGLADALDLEDGQGGPIPATLALTPQASGPSAPVTFVATLPAAVLPEDRERASAALAGWSRTEVVQGAVELSPGGHVRYRWAYGPIGAAWTAGTAGAFATVALGTAEAVLGRAVRALEASGVRFAPAPESAPVPCA